jgi:hypothetical protein
MKPGTEHKFSVLKQSYYLTVCFNECFDKEIVFNADNLQKCLFVVSKHVSISFTCQ